MGDQFNTLELFVHIRAHATQAIAVVDNEF